jgi:hypothetical protein
LWQATSDAKQWEEIGFYSQRGGRINVGAVLDEQLSFNIVAKSQIQNSNPWCSSSPTPIEDSLGNCYTRIGTVTLTWFRFGWPTTFVVEFAVVEENLPAMILGKQACEEAEIKRNLQLLPFGLAPGGGKTKQQKEDEAQRKIEKAEEARERRDGQAQAQAASDQQKRSIEQQPGPSESPRASHFPRHAGLSQQQNEFGSQQTAYAQ